MSAEPIRPPCPACGRLDVFKVSGPMHIDEWNYQQRFECRACKTRFLTWWSGEFLRIYKRRSE